MLASQIKAGQSLFNSTGSLCLLTLSLLNKLHKLSYKLQSARSLMPMQHVDKEQ